MRRLAIQLGVPPDKFYKMKDSTCGNGPIDPECKERGCQYPYSEGGPCLCAKEK